MHLSPEQMGEKALYLVTTRHAGQFDKGGAPYALHPVIVALKLHTKDLALTTIALLHDIVEDTPTTLEELKKLGFSERVVTAVDHLTKRKGLSREENLQRVLQNVDAMRVKLSDLDHNQDVSRLGKLTQKDADRLKWYTQAERIIADELFVEGAGL